ncbi:ubiquitin-conjugating enzyme E2-like protein [Thermochaetoides thermophila DSM 1495]|uniref:Ubiquitin-conjugating enzyme E2-like protein n=1 Tax=Chaetomium thermophilum (strain DSM 1495 / CBS 144.50 / IMI 039719) TaxID=759272 RepID=G0RY81_CHATD|nr:ubiquitin-conjugating enzyme E2-like protein [Thermochaetoides thermophila DSM 1495]EGS23867.1 ubiquitin-conjugating enzyme E2-like protein [Thermochaetoides thermophila DSM 1495]
MEGWVQFCFAQGTPDKELRFNRALREVAARKDIKKHPTIFAWHGSSLANWHSIIRTGLGYNETRNGRSHGNGVYMSRHFKTSRGYSVTGLTWPNSDLKFNLCIGLCEIINAPDEFLSTSPHYVVQQLDWIQCRYLFVQPLTVNTKIDSTGERGKDKQFDQEIHPQPFGCEILGSDDKPLKIPVTAIPIRTVDTSTSGRSSRASLKRETREFEQLGDDSDAEDVRLLFTNDEFKGFFPPAAKRSSSRSSGVKLGDSSDFPSSPTGGIILDPTKTDFEPGAFDSSSLPRLDPPSFANPSSTRALSLELAKLQALQYRMPLHELGWYIDFNSVTNLFQWIVELHSFDSSLPLAQDMKAAGIRSIVMEMRFGADFPFSPPFVRVIRPRFMPFLQGGGGHVTAGGAMCMELLTASGWSPANSMESVLLQVRMALCNLEPQPAKGQVSSTPTTLTPEPVKIGTAAPAKVTWMDYGIWEAIDAYERSARAHGWKIAENWRQTANGPSNHASARLLRSTAPNIVTDSLDPIHPAFQLH